MKKYLLLAILAIGSTSSYADMYKHDLEVFTANTMEIACSGTPKVLFFGEYEKVAKQSAQELKDAINSGISVAGKSVSSWIGAGSIDGVSLGANFVAGLIANLIGTGIKNAAYASIDDPEYLMISECNSGANYTRLITMVVSNEKLPLDVAKKLATADQIKMARKVNK